MLETATRVGKEDQVVKALEEDIIFGRWRREHGWSRMRCSRVFR